MAIADTIKSRTRGRKASQEDDIEVVELADDKDEKGKKSSDKDDIEVVNPKADKRRKGSPKKETSETVESKSDKSGKNSDKSNSKDDSSWEDLPLKAPESSPKKSSATTRSKDTSSAKTNKDSDKATTKDTDKTNSKDTNKTTSKGTDKKTSKDTDKTATDEITEVKSIPEKKSRKRDREENREKPFIPKETSNNDEWNCLMCFLPNLMEDIACVRCLTNRPGAKKSYRWTCTNCSTSNPKAVTICRLCNSDSSSSSGNESSD